MTAFLLFIPSAAGDGPNTQSFSLQNSNCQTTFGAAGFWLAVPGPVPCEVSLDGFISVSGAACDASSCIVNVNATVLGDAGILGQAEVHGNLKTSVNNLSAPSYVQICQQTMFLSSSASCFGAQVVNVAVAAGGCVTVAPHAVFWSDRLGDEISPTTSVRPADVTVELPYSLCRDLGGAPSLTALS